MDQSTSRANDASTTPQRCANGCGFFGNPNQKGLCSKCFKQKYSSTPLFTSNNQAPNVEPLTEGGLPATAAESAAAVPPKTEDDKSTPVVATPAPAAPEAAPSEKAKEETPAGAEAGKAPKVNRRNCFECKRRIGLLGFECKCGNMFCSSHRYPDEHNCQFDFVSHQSNILNNTLTKVVADKVSRI